MGSGSQPSTMNADFGYYSAASSGVNAIASLASAYSQSQSLKAQGRYQRAVAETNAKLAEMNADDALRRGDKEAARYLKQAKGVRGAQRAAMAAQGIEVDSGSAAEIQADTEKIAAENVVTIKTNAFREAWGYRVEGLNQSYAGKFASMAAGNQARDTLLTGGLQALGYGLKGMSYLDLNSGGGGRRTSKIPGSSGYQVE